jgi:hypothetical protein
MLSQSIKNKKSSNFKRKWTIKLISLELVDPYTKNSFKGSRNPIKKYTEEIKIQRTKITDLFRISVQATQEQRTYEEKNGKYPL